MLIRIMKTLFVCAFALLAYTAKAQITYVNTVPPLSGGNGQSGITFNLHAFNDIDVKEIWVSFGSTSSQTVEVWYHPTDSINGVPSVSTANGWVSLGTV